VPPNSGGHRRETATTATTQPDTATETTAAAEESIDLKVAGLAAGLEVPAIQTYQAALDAAGAGSLGEVPPAVGEFVTIRDGRRP
jgi:hypothetical protein